LAWALVSAQVFVKDRFHANVVFIAFFEGKKCYITGSEKKGRKDKIMNNLLFS
jgi:hypothetical protein